MCSQEHKSERSFVDLLRGPFSANCCPLDTSFYGLINLSIVTFVNTVSCGIDSDDHLRSFLSFLILDATLLLHLVQTRKENIYSV
jgi:hypothetical protein